MRRIVDAFAEYERFLGRTRTSAALQAKRARGERVGAIPYGYRLADDGIHVVQDEGEQRIISVVLEQRRLGRSYLGIARFLDEGGHATRRGRPWHPQQVSNICRGNGES